VYDVDVKSSLSLSHLLMSFLLQVLVSILVLEPQSLGLGLGTLESRSQSWSSDLEPDSVFVTHEA